MLLYSKLIGTSVALVFRGSLEVICKAVINACMNIAKYTSQGHVVFVAIEC